MEPELLGIGAFARASRLSPKALRLYDDLGLLRPARVDPVTGYRRYAPDQLEQARLVAWLRRLGMPLARIRRICALAPEQAAHDVRAYWAAVEADTTARRDLAAFLVDHLSGKDHAMPTPLTIRYAAGSDAGLVRANNQDIAYADDRLLAVADGFGPGGARAGAAAVAALKPLKHMEHMADPDSAAPPAGGLLAELQDAVDRAEHAVRALADTDGARTPDAPDDDSRAGTTLTAMLWTGSRLALVHIGDTRVYLLRGGELFRITQDHTLVQAMVDEGRITAEEAAGHPQRALLLRALAPGADGTPDLRLHDAEPGDRYLLCSDGLSAVVPDPDLRRAVVAADGPEQAVRDLIALANAHGGPDNIGCVVADVLAA
ncbi:MerR family transcriptional regulator [Actinacidiphila acididurans]|uniref:MerR family transcriptional regulator n=1 Tax=Actinacidiphila acididurans TaxID=2784346 RepID=A0ABS2TYR8_9ACTN|nr:MerR family transcriptional regulator [Actinacidiphila acididurans]MBM9508479.1 MerR family transcriptional regulator [Actinacidiphila acididurans]